MGNNDYQTLFCPECASDDLDFFETVTLRREVLGLNDTGALCVSEASEQEGSDVPDVLSCLTCGYGWNPRWEISYV